MRICDDLRQAVLQAAIQGKLTKQLPEDGNAADLLKEIAKEKAQIIREGKIKKEKPLPEITVDEIPFDIPDNWKWCHLGNAIKEIIVPQRDKPPFSCNGIIPWCRIEDRDGKFLHGTKSNQYVSKETIDTMNLKVLPVGTVLTACTGGSIGTIVINTKPCCTNQTFNGIVCGNKIYNWYVFWFLVSKFQELKTLGSGTTIAYVSQDKTRAMLFPLPPLAEQHRIVAKVEELMARIDDLEKTETELEKLKAAFPGDMKAALLQAAIQGKLTEQLPEDGDAADLINQIAKEKDRLIKEGKIKKEKPLPEITPDEIPFDIPENWQWCKVGHILSMQAGKNTVASSIRDIKDAEYKYPCYGGNGIRGYKTEYNREGFHAIVGRQGALCGNINYAKGKFYATEHAVVVDCYAKMDMTCVGLFLKALNLNQYATATAQPGLSVAKIIDTPFPLPPLAEQKRIVEKLDKLLPLCDGLVEE